MEYKPNNNNEYYTFGFERNILENTLKTSYLYPDYIDVFERKQEIIKRRLFALYQVYQVLVKL